MSDDRRNLAAIILTICCFIFAVLLLWELFADDPWKWDGEPRWLQWALVVFIVAGTIVGLVSAIRWERDNSSLGDKSRED